MTERRRTSKLASSGASAMLDTSRHDTTNTPTPQASTGERVSFNCRMDRELRRAVRRYAADTDMDIQDIVDQALREYLTTRTPTSPEQTE